MSMSLDGIRVLDLSRVLAGPFCTQTLGDLGADVIKIERPGVGDDTRRWGPPFLQDAAGTDTTESAYYLCCNRNKRSVAVDIAKPAGQSIIRTLLASSDVLVENFKVGDLARFGLSYDQLCEEFPRLVYCSITGFGQTGPYAARAGYDYLAQGMGGIMSVTGEADGMPTKVGVAIADVMTGMQSAIAILAALRHRDATGSGQHIDAALLDTQVSWLVNQATNFLISGKAPGRLGNAHPNVAPYQVFETLDGHLILAIGNDGQFVKFCNHVGQAELAQDEQFATNAARITNRELLAGIVTGILTTKSTNTWISELEGAGVPCGPVNDIAGVFDDPQVQARDMQISMEHPLSVDPIDLVAYPLKLSDTPAQYRRPPPILGQHTEEVLTELAGMSADEVTRLKESAIL